MSWFDGVRERLRFLVARGRVERELEEELAFHQEREVERPRALGMTQVEAERTARIAFGGRERHVEESRRVWAGILSGVGQDLPRGFRRLRQQPGLTAVARRAASVSPVVALRQE